MNDIESSFISIPRRAGILILTAIGLRPGFFLALALAGVATANAQPSNSSRSLFNGKDFAGWTFFMQSNAPPEATWSVAHGVIHCTGVPNGYMRTEESFSNYTLTVEWRFVKITPNGRNTGILVHMQLPEDIWPRCVECQGYDQKQGDFWLQSGATADGYPDTGKKSVNVPMTHPSNEKPIGEWNTYQVITRGNAVEIIVNGKSMNKITGANVSSGFIGIQSEGAEIEVRRMDLQPGAK